MIPGGWLGILIAGIILGALGQGARTIVGFKKLNDYTDAAAAAVDGWRLLISFGIGGVAGALAAVTILPGTEQVMKEQLFAIAAAGYAGADFIEGFISRFAGNGTSTGSNTGAPAANASADGAVG
jgi:hypothetical protein